MNKTKLFQDMLKHEPYDLAGQHCHLYQLGGVDAVRTLDLLNAAFECNETEQAEAHATFRTYLIMQTIRNNDLSKTFNSDDIEDVKLIAALPQEMHLDIYYKAAKLNGYDFLLPEEVKVKK